MKSRLVMFLALILSAGSLVLLSSSSASAATYSARLSQLHPVPGELVRITGAVNPAGRPLSLLRYANGRWGRVASTRTVSYGRYAFTVRALSTAYSYRSYAPRVRIRNRTYAAAYSQVVRVTSVKPTLTLGVGGAPVGQTQAGATNLTPAVAVFRPARPNVAVAVQKVVNGTWTSVASARQNKSGVAYLQVPAGAAATPGLFRAYTRPALRVANVFSSSVTPTYLTKKWGDEFDGTTLDTTKWQYRLQAAGGKRQCSTPASAADGLVTVARGVASLKVKKVALASSACRYGTYKNSMIAATGSDGFSSQYGVYAARVKFQTARGMHGSYWLQGPAVTGAEIDVAEYFGDGRVDSGLSSFVHYTDSKGALSTSGGIRNIASVLGARKTPSNGWHVYSVEWSPTGYVFRLDGTPILSTSKPRVATSPETMILSLLTSDYELPYLRTTVPTMQVDWVRVWQK